MNESLNALLWEMEQVSKILTDAEFRIGQKVLYRGEVDEIEGYCPLSMIKLLPQGGLKETYIGMGYNLKKARVTARICEFKKIV